MKIVGKCKDSQPLTTGWRTGCRNNCLPGTRRSRVGCVEMELQSPTRCGPTSGGARAVAAGRETAPLCGHQCCHVGNGIACAASGGEGRVGSCDSSGLSEFAPGYPDKWVGVLKEMRDCSPRGAGRNRAGLPARIGLVSEGGMAIVSQTDVSRGFAWPQLCRDECGVLGGADSVVTFAHEPPAACARYRNQVVALR
jgi:hypothetical protein